MRMTKFFDLFLEFEKRENMMERRISGVPYWHLVRVPIFRRILADVFCLKSAHPDFSGSRQVKSRAERILGKFTAVWNPIYDFCFRNPLFALRRRELLFSMTPRQAVLDNGRKVSLLLDFFVPLMHTRYGLLEYVLTKPSRQPFFRKVFHLPHMAGRFDECRSGRRFAEMSEQSRIHSKEIAAKLSTEFGRNIDSGFIASQIEGALLYREAYRPVFTRAISKMKTEVIVTAVQYNLFNFTLTEAAHDLGVKVVELQHGTIYKAHAAYNLPSGGSVYSPDYLLTWGEHWNGQLLNYPNGRAIAAGYPFLEHFAKKCRPQPRREGAPLRVLFISQGDIAAELSRTAVHLAKMMPRETCRITYKLHPNESATWRELYPWLENSGVEVVSHDDKNIFECLRQADVTVGSSSTSLIEGFAWGVRSLVLKWLPGSEIMADFCGTGAAEFVESEDDLCAILRSMFDGVKENNKIGLDFSRYWMPDAAKNIADFLDSLVVKGAKAQTM